MSFLLSEDRYKKILQLQIETTKLYQSQMAGLATRRREANPSAAIMRPTAAAAKDPLGGLGARTLVNYRRRAEKLLSDARSGDVPVWELVDMRSSTTGSWRTARASLQVVLLEAIRADKREIDNYMRRFKTGPFTWEDGVALKVKVEDLVFNASQLRSLPEPRARATVGNKKKRRQSKSLSLEGLPVDWREQLAAQLVPATRLQWLVQAVCGCRSQELEWGVKVCLTDDRREVSFEIEGAKGTEFAGQEWRKFSVPTDAGVVQRLAQELGEGGCRIVSTDVALPTYAARISAAGKKLWPMRAGARAVSPYSARHQVKADMKARGLSDVEIAAAMGHSTTKSQKYYGGSGKTAGAVAPTNIEAARRVKVKPGYAPMQPVTSRTASNRPQQKTQTSPRESFAPEVKTSASRTVKVKAGFSAATEARTMAPEAATVAPVSKPRRKPKP